MAIAARIAQCDPAKAEWLTIQDDTGATWTYRQTGPAETGATPHVVFAVISAGGLQVVLTHRKDGAALLQQDELGLPRAIVVRLLLHPTPEAGTIVGSPGLFLYQRD